MDYNRKWQDKGDYPNLSRPNIIFDFPSKSPSGHFSYPRWKKTLSGKCSRHDSRPSFHDKELALCVQQRDKWRHIRDDGIRPWTSKMAAHPRDDCCQWKFPKRGQFQKWLGFCRVAVLPRIEQTCYMRQCL